MTNYGAKIAELRAAHKMTQAQLGEKLNVTSQAVSKWEKGLSEPDIESIRKICEIFQITFDEFFGAAKKEDEPVEEQPMAEEAQPTTEEKPTASEETQPAPTVPVNPPAVILAYCDMCDKPLHNPREYQVTIENGVQHTTCMDCVAIKRENQRKAHDDQLANERRSRQATEWATVKKGLLWGILGGVGLGAIMIAGATTEDTVMTIVGIILGIYGGYAMVTQFVWMNSVWDVFCFFLRSFKFPGVIFTLSLEGIISLIFIKILGAILCALLSVLLFIVGFFVTWAYAMILFPFALIKQIRDIKKMY